LKNRWNPAGSDDQGGVLTLIGLANFPGIGGVSFAMQNPDQY